VPRATNSRIRRVMQTARHYFGLDIGAECARRVIRWDEDGSFVGELSDDGQLDAAPRDYFSMAMIDAIMPGLPEVQDDFIGLPQERWHWPLNGSSPDYRRAFAKAWQKAIKRLRATS
jgi:hypothetical protein